MAHIYYISSSMKFVEEPPLIVSSFAAAQQTLMIHNFQNLAKRKVEN